MMAHSDSEPKTPTASSSMHRWPLTPPATRHRDDPLFLPTSTTPSPTPLRQRPASTTDSNYFQVLESACRGPLLRFASTNGHGLGTSIPLRPVLCFHATAVPEQPMPELRVLLARDGRNATASRDGTTVERLSEELEHVDLRPLPTKRPRRIERAEEDEADYVEYTGQISAPPAGPKPKRQRITPVAGSTSTSSTASSILVEIDDTPSPPPRADAQPAHRFEGPCVTCGCNCSAIPGRGKGSGSTTLSRGIMGRLLHAMLNSTNALDALRTADPSITQWADVAEAIGARREDFDRVRHASKWMQDNLGRMKMRGEF